MIKKYIVALAVLLSIVLMLGCSERDDMVTRPNYDVRNGFESAITNDGGHMYSFYLAFSFFRETLHSSAPPRFQPRSQPARTRWLCTSSTGASDAPPVTSWRR